MGAMPPGYMMAPGQAMDYHSYYAQYYQQQQQSEEEAKRKEEAKRRLNAYAASKSGTPGPDAVPAKKTKNKELKKFFDDENSEMPEKPKVKTTMMDKMAEITKEIEKEKEIDAIVLEKKIKELQWKYKTNRSRSGSRGRRSGSRRSRSRSRDRRSRGRRDERRKRSGSRSRRSRSRSRDRKSRSRGDG